MRGATGSRGSRIQRAFGTESAMLKNLMCKLNLGHDWHVEHNEDGSRYRRCTRCGKYDDGGDPGGGRWAVPDIG